MELPRFQSRALPQAVTLSPQMAAAEAGAMSQALASGLDVVAQVTSRIQSAEAEAAAQAALAETSLRVREFSADPRWTMPEIDGEPTDQVLKREWDKLSADLLATTPVIRDRAAKQTYDLRRKELLGTAGVEIAGQQRTLQVERGKALTDFTADRHAQMGDFGEAQKAYDRGIESGLYSTSEYLKRSQDLQILEVEDGYLSKMGPDATDTDLPTLGTDILSDSRLPAANRRSLFRSLVSETERRDRTQGKALKERQSVNAVVAWQNVDRLSVDQIAAADIGPEDKETLIRYKRNQLIDGVDDPAAISEVSGLMAGLANGSATRMDVQSAITRNQAAGKLSAQRSAELLTGMARTSDQLWQDPVFDRLQREGELAINKGVASEQLINLFAQSEARERAALAVEWRQKFLTAKMDGGASFDAQKWYADNLGKFIERSKTIAEVPLSTEWEPYRVKLPNGNTDVLKTREKLDSALKAGTLNARQHQDAGRALGLAN